MWMWITLNSGTFQGFAALIGIPFTISTLVFVVAATRAARVQAYASCRQAEAAENAAEMSLKQMYQSIASQDRSLTPVLNFDFSDPRQLRVTNIGKGPAYGLVVNTGGQRWRAENDVVGEGESVAVWAGFDPLSDDTIEAHYSSQLGRSHNCICGIDGDTRFRMQQHSEGAAPFDEMVGIKFIPSPECESLRKGLKLSRKTKLSRQTKH